MKSLFLAIPLLVGSVASFVNGELLGQRVRP